MTPKLRLLARQFDQRPVRERALMAAAALAVALAAGDALWLTPALQRYQAARLQQRSAQAASQTLQADLLRLAERRQTDARDLKAELATWRQRVRDGEAALHAHEAALVGPDRMLDLLDELLARHGQVRVRAMRSLGQVDLLAPAGSPTALGSTAGPLVAPLSPMSPMSGAGNHGGGNANPPMPGAPAAPPAGPVPGTAPAMMAGLSSVAPVGAAPSAAAGAVANPGGSLYRHGVELTLEGGYGDLMAYLQALEDQPHRVLWGGLALRVDQHPKSLLTLRLYTISRDRTWLEL